jgi:hypothetical protein
MDIVTISDHIGRTVVGEKKEETKTTLTLSNPVIVHVQPDQQSGQLQVQSFPYIFMEFIKGEEKTNNWTFAKDAIVVSDVQLNNKIIEQYKGINSPAPAESASGDPEVVKLFDD